MEIGLALSGGGVKGAAHIGVLKALEEEKIKIDYIAGTSSGSIVSTLYAAGFSPDDIYYIFKKYCKKIKYVDIKNIFKLFFGLFTTLTITIDGLNSGKSIKKLINKVCARKNIYNISDIKMPLVIPSVNMNNGDVVCFTSSKIRNFSNKTIFVNDANIGECVQASCSFPTVFSPCSYKDIKLVDGGIRENTPWREWKKVGVDKVICIGFETKKEPKKEKNMVDVISDSLGILCHELSNYELYGVDYLIKIKTKDVSLLDTKQISYLYEQGYNQAKKFIKVELSKML